MSNEALSIGQPLYRVISHLDMDGIEWTRVDRSYVTDISSYGWISGTLIEAVTFPNHTPPESWTAAVWETPDNPTAMLIDQSSVGTSWTTALLELPTAEVLPSETEQDYLRHKAELYSAKAGMRPRAPLTPESRRLELIHEYREGLKSWG